MKKAKANGGHSRRGKEEGREDKRRKEQPTLFELMGYSYQVIVTKKRYGVSIMGEPIGRT